MSTESIVYIHISSLLIAIHLCEFIQLNGAGANVLNPELTENPWKTISWLFTNIFLTLFLTQWG